MTDKKGYNLVEITVVLFILGILAAIIIPNYSNYVQKGYAQAAANNLNIISNLQKNYHFSNTGFCTTTSAPVCGDTLNDLDTNLSANITDDQYSYACTATAPALGFCCTATIKSGELPSNISLPSSAYRVVANNTGIQLCGT